MAPAASVWVGHRLRHPLPLVVTPDGALVRLDAMRDARRAALPAVRPTGRPTRDRPRISRSDRRVGPRSGQGQAAYWTTADGSTHGSCHNYLRSEGEWVTCGITIPPGSGPVRVREGVVEKDHVIVTS